MSSSLQAFKFLSVIKNNEMNQKSPLNISPKELKKWLDEGSECPLLVDVREKEELAIASLNQEVLHLPLSDSLTWATKLPEKLSFQKPVVVLCHTGIRSWNFGVWLLEQDSRYQVWNLQGGIDAWSEQVDESVPKY